MALHIPNRPDWLGDLLVKLVGDIGSKLDEHVNTQKARGQSQDELAKKLMARLSSTGDPHALTLEHVLPGRKPAFDINILAERLAGASSAAEQAGFGGLGEELAAGARMATAVAGGPATIIMFGVQEIIRRLGAYITETKAAFQSLGGAFRGETVGQVGSSIGGFYEHMGAAMGGPPGALVSGLSKLTRVLFEATDRLRSWSEGLHRANIQFAEFSASMSAVQLQQEVREISLIQQRGERRAEFAGRLAEARFGFERRITPFEDAWAKLKSELAIILLNAGSRIIDNSSLAQGLRQLIDQWLQNPNNLFSADTQLGGFVSPEMAESFLEYHGRPLRFGGAAPRAAPSAPLASSIARTVVTRILPQGRWLRRLTNP